MDIKAKRVIVKKDVYFIDYTNKEKHSILSKDNVYNVLESRNKGDKLMYKVECDDGKIDWFLAKNFIIVA